MADDAPNNYRKALVKRAGKDARGRFVKGHKFGKGRPKGSKNRATLVREQMAEHGTLMLGRMFPHLLKKAMEMALAGDREMLKEMLARGMPKNRTDTEGVPDRIDIVINNLIANKPDKTPDIAAEVVDAEVVNETPRLEHKEADPLSVVVRTRGRETVQRN